MNNSMKKLIASVLVLIMVLGICTTSFATKFNKTVQCVNENDYVKSATSDEKLDDDFAIYVHYNAKNCSNKYTNHFRGYCAETGEKEGQKWVVPGSTIPIQGSGFSFGWRYYLTMRGNTRYHENENRSKIKLEGWFLAN